MLLRAGLNNKKRLIQLLNRRSPFFLNFFKASSKVQGGNGAWQMMIHLVEEHAQNRGRVIVQNVGHCGILSYCHQMNDSWQKIWPQEALLVQEAHLIPQHQRRWFVETWQYYDTTNFFFQVDGVQILFDPHIGKTLYLFPNDPIWVSAKNKAILSQRRKKRRPEIPYLGITADVVVVTYVYLIAVLGVCNRIFSPEKKVLISSSSFNGKCKRSRCNDFLGRYS